jgi:beta-lactamase regulating signal transducer with metallopeptidase domain
MISEIFKAILIMSLVGSVLTGIISLFRPITKKIFGYSWHYYIWLCVLFVMLIPVRFNINPTTAPSIITQTAQTEQTAQQTSVGNQPETVENVIQTDTAQKPQVLQKVFGIWNRIVYNRVSILAWLWLISAMLLILLNIARYISLNVKIRKNGEIISLSEIGEYTNRKINVRVWESIASPFMTGVIKPTLILPKTELSSEQLHNILCHEMTHFKRRDILYKCFAEFVKCVHWFNPVIWYVTRQIATECEISCDIAVTKNMSDSEEMSYINTILSLLPMGKSKQLPLTTQMASSKKILKRRFIMIKNKKTTSRFMSVISAVIAVAMLSTTVFASGVLSDLTTDDYTIEILNNGEKIELTNKPFIENGEVYLPLRETLTNIGTLNHTGSYITWDNGKIEVHLADVITETMGIADIEFSFEIGKPDFIIDPHGTPNIFFRSIKTSPILKDNLTYVPYSLMEPMMEFDTNNRVNNVGYTIFDKNGNIIEITSNQQTVIKTSQYDNTTPEYTVDQFFYLFSNGDFGNMKRYCTQNCIDNFFRENSVFGMKKATLQSIDTVDNLAERGFTNGEWAALVNVTMMPTENSVFDPNQTETSFYMILKQQDGRYLIDEFATGL